MNFREYLRPYYKRGPYKPKTPEDAKTEPTDTEDAKDEPEDTDSEISDIED